jgi:hypothetical protein
MKRESLWEGNLDRRRFPRLQLVDHLQASQLTSHSPV